MQSIHKYSGWVHYFLAAFMLVLLVAPEPGEGAVVHNNVSPKNTGISGQARISLNLPAGSFDGNTPIGRVARIAPVQLSGNGFRANWRLSCANTGDTASSSRGEFILDGAVIATTGQLFEPSCIPAGSVTPENVVIPDAVVQAVNNRVRSLPLRALYGKSVTDAFSVYYRRAFRDTTGPARVDQVNIVFRIVVGGDVRITPEAEPAVTLPPAAPEPLAPPGFQLTRVDLAFDDNSRLRVDDPGATRHVIATINYLGTGFLRATWELAPVVAGAAPFFRPLPGKPAGSATAANASFDQRHTRTLVREYLGQFQLVSLRSPPLPDDPGRYLIRLNIDSPEAPFALPAIEYRVGSGSTETTAAPEPVPMRLSLANPESGLTPESELRWEPVGLTEAYRYEIYADGADEDQMITGAVFPASQQHAGLSALVMEHLVPGNAYRVRVVAIDAEGRVHGESPFLDTRFSRP
jgi:hypothetical protein